MKDKGLGPVINFSEVVEISRGISYSSANLTHEGLGRPMINLRNVDKGGGFRMDGLKYYDGEVKDRHSVLPGDLLIANTDLSKAKDVLGSPILVPTGFGYENAVFSLDLTKLSINKDIATIGYVRYFLESPRTRIFMKENGSGTTIMHLRVQALSNLKIPLPSLEKQREIVEKLDNAFAEIDLLERVHSQVNTGLSSVLFDTCRNGLLTALCSGFDEIEFGEIGRFVRGPFGGSLKKSTFKKSGIAIYEQQHAINNSFKSFRYFVDELKYEEMKRFEVEANDLIMSCSGTYGKIAIVPQGSPKGIINQALLKITPSNGVRSQFIKHWMQSGLFQSELEKGVGGAALQNVPSVAKMKSIQIRLPSEEVQIEIQAKLEAIEVEINRVRFIQDRIKDNYVALRQSILSNAFSQEGVDA